MMIESKVLVVDDQETQRQKLLNAIYLLGHEVNSAADGTQALSMMRDSPYDLILLDIIMPEMDGFEVMQRMQEDPDLKEVPVIVISSLDCEVDMVVRAIEYGAEDFLPKNFDKVLLNARVNSSLEKKHARDRQNRETRQIKRLTTAASMLERNLVNPDQLKLDDVSAQSSDIGVLSRVFTSMATQVYERERDLKKSNHTLIICCLGMAIGFIAGLSYFILS